MTEFHRSGYLNLKYLTSHIIIFGLLWFNYSFGISKKFAYLGFNTDNFTIYKMISVVIIGIGLIILSAYIRRSYYRFFYSVTLSLYAFPALVYYSNTEEPIVLAIYMILPSISFIIADRLDDEKIISRRVFDMQNRKTKLLFVILFLACSIPFFRNIGSVSISNLWFHNIYETRLATKNLVQGILGYLQMPLSRVIFPFFFVYGWKYKQKLLCVLSGAMVIALYLLTGAIKSVLLGLFCTAIFLFGSYQFKEKIFINLMICINLPGLFFKLTKGIIIFDDYARRFFYVPCNLFETYYQYFTSNHTYFLHSHLARLLGIETYSGSLSSFVGESVIGKSGLNANVGIFTEGFLSFGTLGVLFATAIFMLVFIYFRKLNFSSDYAGILFVYVYVMNTAFVETLLITHGLLCLMMLAYFFFPVDSPQKSDLTQQISTNRKGVSISKFRETLGAR